MTFVRCALITITITVIMLAAAPAIASYSNPDQFWMTFRQAVLANDTNKIISMTHFPFMTRGPTDNSPTIKYGREKFPHIFRKVLAQEEEVMTSEGRFETKALFELIKEKKKISSKDFNTPESLWIYALKFKLINGSWFLTWAYTDD